LALLLARPSGVILRMTRVNLSVFLVFSIVLFLDVARRQIWTGVVRDWAPLGLLLLAYREMDWFAVAHHTHLLEFQWVTWDRMLFQSGGRGVIELLGPVIPAILEVAYALTYALPPFALAVLYVCRRRDLVDRFQQIVLASVLICYAQFPFWPSDPPRILFAGQDLPAYFTIFRRFNLWLLGNYGIHTSVFPSAHVATSLSTALAMRSVLPSRKWIYRGLFVMAMLVALATVYGRYHYAADAVAGASVAMLCAVGLATSQFPVISRDTAIPPATPNATALLNVVNHTASSDGAKCEQ
jgi:membrane-associated phospholipid phosphatase